MKNERKQKALKEYENTMIKAADARRDATNKIEATYQNTKTEAHNKFLRDAKDIK